MVATTESPTSCEDKWPAKRCNAQKDKNRCDKMRVIEYCQKTCGYCECKLVNSKTLKDEYNWLLDPNFQCTFTFTLLQMLPQ